MSQLHLGSEGQTFPRDSRHALARPSTRNGIIKQGSNLMTATVPIAMTQNNNNILMQNNSTAAAAASTVRMGMVQQQQQQLQQHQIPMMWKAPGYFGPNPVMTPIAPLSAANITLAPESVNISESNTTQGRKMTPSASKSKKGKPSKVSNKANNELEDIDNNDKTEKNRERNREHARCTRLRKKAYVQKLKNMAHGLRSVQTKEIRERRVSMQNLLNIQKVRRSVVQTVLNYHAGYEKDTMKWKVLLEDSFWMKEPVTPFRSFRRSEVDRDCRIVRGIDAVICDAASIAVMVERIGCYNARWRRIKRSDFLGSLDRQDMLNQDIDDIGQQPESSLSGESSSDSSRCSEINIVSQRNLVSSHPEGTSHAANTVAKVSSSSESDKTNQIYSESTFEQNFKTNTSSSDDTTRDTPAKRRKMDIPNIGSFCPNVSRTGGHHPALGPAYSNMVDVEDISAFYAVNEDDMSILDDVLMCPFVFRTKNTVLCGALADCVVPGMLRANFSKNNKLLNMELVFDAMGFMQQLDGANGGDINAQVIPGSLEMALVPCPNEARAITEALPPYRVIHVNEPWSSLTKYSQTEAEGKPLLRLLQGNSSDSGPDRNTVSIIRSQVPSVSLEDVTKGRPACSTSIHYRKVGRSFVDFMCSYPLTNATDDITHLLHVSTELPQTAALIS